MAASNGKNLVIGRILGLALSVALSSCGSGTSSTTVDANSNAMANVAVSKSKVIDALLGLQDDTDAPALVDYGPGPGAKLQEKIQSLAAGVTGSAIPSGGTSANVTGVFGPVAGWPIIMIHVVLLPDGRVMSYGTNQQGAQGAQYVYDVWDPSLGGASNSHLLLPNTTPTDLFCSSQSVLPSGDVLLTGGDLTLNGVRNFARNDTNIFSPVANSLATNTPMNYARWYGSLVSLSDGRLAVFGGYQNQTGSKAPVIPSITPELYDPATRAWTSLSSATSKAAFGAANGIHNWYYPKTYVAPGGNLFLLANDGHMYSISTAGAGNIAAYTSTAPVGQYDLPTIPFAPGKLLSLRQNLTTIVVDYSGSTPVVAQTDPIDQVRIFASGTVMADGRVLITGGSAVRNQLTGVAYTVQIWDPATGHWTAGATATKPRLYHSNSLLLPDATVLTGGGGAPGPVRELNAEIFYPPYLYAADGSAATRPALAAAGPLAVNMGSTIVATVGPTDLIQRLTFVRTGSATHNNNSDQRFIDLPFMQEGQNLSATLPSDSSILVPGRYMLFAFNDAGVPSKALIFSVSL